MRYFASIVFAVISSSLIAANHSIDTITIESVVLQEIRKVFILKPNNLRVSDSVTIIYMLDGEDSNSLFKQISKDPQNKSVVGIGIPNTERRRDLLPNEEPQKFLSFLEKELIPKIENIFIVGSRKLFGHSIAGGFVVYALIKQTNLFDSYIASSPTPIMQMIDSTIYKNLDIAIPESVKFYFSHGEKDMKQVRKWASILNKNLKPLELNKLDWRFEIFPGEKHYSSGYIAIIKGLKF